MSVKTYWQTLAVVMTSDGANAALGSILKLVAQRYGVLT
jgi:hypothetical protein